MKIKIGKRIVHKNLIIIFKIRLILVKIYKNLKILIRINQVKHIEVQDIKEKSKMVFFHKTKYHH